MSRSAPGRPRLAGHWRITEMDEWDEIDLLGRTHHVTGKDGGKRTSPSKSTRCAISERRRTAQRTGGQRKGSKARERRREEKEKKEER